MEYETSLVLYLTEFLLLLELEFLNIFVQYSPDFKVI